jgi:pantothenate kinase
MAAAVDAAMLGTYDALATEVVAQRFDKATIGQGQYWIAIAGGPGSGKSTLSSNLVQRVNYLCKAQGALNDVAVCLPMDGFHFSRDQLQKLAVTHEKDGVTFETLLARRGSPWTFDVDHLVSSLSEARRTQEGLLPVYSRPKSDPIHGDVDECVRLEKYHQIVFVEGNYLLNWDAALGAATPGQAEGSNLQDAAKWRLLEPLFDETWFVSCQSMDLQRKRLIARHLETWTEEKTRMFGAGGTAGAAIKADTNDVPNAHFVDLHRKHASREIVSLQQ